MGEYFLRLLPFCCNLSLQMPYDGVFLFESNRWILYCAHHKIFPANDCVFGRLEPAFNRSVYFTIDQYHFVAFFDVFLINFPSWANRPESPLWLISHFSWFNGIFLNNKQCLTNTRNYWNIKSSTLKTIVTRKLMLGMSSNYELISMKIVSF